MSYSIKLEDFEGPLDLLLHLIRQNKINILDIPIAEITRQYTSIIDSWEFFDMQEACDYLDMATRLMKIKSQMILPRVKVELEEEEQDPREELVKQLQTYALFQEVVKELEPVMAKNLLAYEKDPVYDENLIITKPTNINIKALARVVHRIILSREQEEVNTISIKPEKYSVEEMKLYVLNQLRKKEYVTFSNLIKIPDPEAIITVFLAFLELYKTGVLSFEQSGNEITLNAS